MRATRALAALLILVLVAACGGGPTGDSGGDDNGNDTESAAPGGGDSTDPGDGGAEPSDDGDDGGDDGNGGTGSLDVDRVFETLTPPNASELSKTTTAGVIFAAWDSDDSLDSLRSFYEGAIADSGLQIIQTTEAQGGVAWVVAEDESGSFGGTVSIFPASDGTGTQISVTIGESN
jgi:hypothetical protein